MSNIKTASEYRKLHLEVSNWFVVLIFAAQVVMFLALKKIGMEMDQTKYIIFHIIIPSLVNCISVGVTFKINKNKKITENVKNIVFIVNTFIMSFGIILSENMFPASISVALVPIIVATGFGSDLYLNIATGLSYISLLAVDFIYPYIHGEDQDIYISISYVEFSIIIILVRVVAGVIKDFCLSSASKIESHESNNVNLENKLLRDAMTGLYNHASFYGFLDTITKANSEDISTITLAIIDIDNFKKVNDTYGHSKGDEVILFLADVLKRRFTDVGYVCRYGGEEFAVIFINKNGRQAKELMEGALEEFRRHEFSWKEDPVTFSCGICEYMSGRMTDKELFGIADKVLYRAKNSGKNQCLL